MKNGAVGVGAADIPSVDLSFFFVDEGIITGESPTEAQLVCAKAIDHACRKHGFLHVTGFGVSTQLYQDAFAASKELFHQKDNHSNCRPWHPSHNMGFSPIRTESTNPNRPPELKEAFNIRFPPVSFNDYRGCPTSFKTAAEELLPILRKAAHRYAMACALALNIQPLDFFDSKLQSMDLCTIRFLHYPPCDYDATGISIDKPIRVGEHTDFGAFTFLLLGPLGAEGLQIKPVAGGVIGGTAGGEESNEWLNVQIPAPSSAEDAGNAPHDNGCGAIVNTGALMARWTNDQWRATAHRVIVPTELEASRDRYSIAFFVDPDATALVQVHDKFVTQDTKCRYDPITGLDFLQMKLSEMANPVKKQ